MPLSADAFLSPSSFSSTSFDERVDLDDPLEHRAESPDDQLPSNSPVVVVVAVVVDFVEATIPGDLGEEDTAESSDWSEDSLLLERFVDDG